MNVPSTPSFDRFIAAFLRYQHVFVFAAPVLFVGLVYAAAPTPAGAGADYWLEFWWLFPFFLLGATIVNTVGISGAALFVPFLIFIFPLFADPLSSQTLVKVGLISESFGLSSSALAFISYGLVDRRLSIALVAGALPLVVGGAFLSFFLPEPVFQLLLGLVLVISAVLLFRLDLGHEAPGEDADDSPAAAADGGTEGVLPDDADKLGVAGVAVDDGQVTRVDKDGNEYRYDRSGYLRRFGTYGFGGIFQGVAGFGIGEIGIVSMLTSSIPVRVAIGTNHIVVATTAIIASLTHVFGGGLVGHGTMNLASTPWNMVVFTVPATVIGGQIAPYVAAALDTSTLKLFVASLFALISTALFVIAGQALL
ncbi:Sulfite exporter TauE/SafE [Natronoarchaeum philippinense]|uniref:Probable membrane transporter protein n=1 Tax=Natronoarchaeum philippinense TaxID=558529 RepID=A0A285NX64_NATPI|nr:sulfite exporter TauE/SafE family protein [Natronoarchaeum philippinense]SNZ12486.1 Sulfite exporter TauE/SafE [Natronoarchaeum philippinense]